MVDINEDGEFIIYPSKDERSFVENIYFLCKLADDIPEGQTFEEFYEEFKEETFYNIMDDISSILKNFRILITHSTNFDFKCPNCGNKIGDTFPQICVKCRARITEEMVNGSQIDKSKCPYCGNRIGENLPQICAKCHKRIAIENFLENTLEKHTDMYSIGVECDLCEKEILLRDIIFDINLNEEFVDEDNIRNVNYSESSLTICKKCKDNYFPDLIKVVGELVKTNMTMLYKLRKNKKNKPT